MLKSKRKTLGKVAEMMKKDTTTNKVDVFMSHVKNNLSMFSKPGADSLLKSKSKHKKRPSSSDSRKPKKKSLGSLVDIDSAPNDLTSPGGFYDTII
jgi:hypothetical protein